MCSTKVVNKLENSNPNCLSNVSGDFNSADLRSSLPNYNQVVTCSTRGNRKLDTAYVNVKGKNTYQSRRRCGFGSSDLDCVALIPTYKAKHKKFHSVVTKM